jgi:CubicO group peptidase (beta-lactamase class C family)
MSADTLWEFVEATATGFGIPGVAVGVWADGREIYACHGVTSIDNPLPVDQDTLFVLGSVTKTFTATALMRLVADRRVELEAPVRQYVPELKLANERAAAEVTVLHLLNHTSGLDWGSLVDTGEGDDALAANVAKLAELEQIAPPGARASYSQAGYNLVGRILEKVTGLTYERAVASLVFEPLGLSHSFFAAGDAMTRRFAVGHNLGEDGTWSIARLWKHWRGNNPGAGVASSVSDQLRWARFHLGDGRAESGVCVLPAEMLHQMKQPTVALHGSTLGDAFGICWFLRDVDGVRTPRARRFGQRPVRRTAHRTRAQFRHRLAVQRRPQRHPVQPGRRPLGAADLPRRGRPRPGAAAVRLSAGSGDRRKVRHRRHDARHRRQ